LPLRERTITGGTSLWAEGTSPRRRQRQHAGHLRVGIRLYVGESAGKTGSAGLCGDKAAGTCAARGEEPLRPANWLYGRIEARSGDGQQSAAHRELWSGARLPRGGVLVACRGLAAHGGAQEPAQAACGLLMK
jgi:hypothetical protein